MPMIEVKVTMSLSSEKRNALKTELGKALSVMDKPESFLL